MKQINSFSDLTNRANLLNVLENILFYLFYLHISLKSVPLQCVFHSIRFKVNKGWSKALLLFYFIPLPHIILHYLERTRLPYYNERNYNIF